ncbi:hypothetical protein L1987_85893 [Smallanthus sonchifolius]|uniref:Uncharacterized protein n=1 Tax=Smallanthus sonchifolius TaxID=185202 RepID=A0ACB8XYG8_9ASTR|nr:hypothetical protein L1987_85893 [Smallanthus sonchifolius]
MDLWEECRRFGHIVDAYIPKKKDNLKGKFGLSALFDKSGQKVGSSANMGVGYKNKPKTNDTSNQQEGLRFKDNGLGGEVTYTEALLGNKRNHSVKLVSESKIAMGWEKLSLVGEVMDVGILSDLKSRLNGLIVCGADLRYLGGLKVLLTFTSSVEALDSPLRKSRGVNLEWKGKVYQVWVQETSKCWDPGFIKNPSISATSSSATSPEGEVEL